MVETVVNLEVNCPVEEQCLAAAVDKFAQWRGVTAVPNAEERDAPDIMVKTTCRQTSIRKTLIFQEALWAEKFLSLWQSELQLKG